MLDYMDRYLEDPLSVSDKYGCGHYKKIRTDKPAIYKDIPRYYSRYGLQKEKAENYLKNLSCVLNFSSGYYSYDISDDILVSWSI